MILAGEKGNGDGYNLNNPNAYSVLEIAQTFGKEIKMIDGYPGRTESGEITSDKARTELGWQTTIDVMDYIKDFTSKHPKK